MRVSFVEEEKKKLSNEWEIASLELTKFESAWGKYGRHDKQATSVRGIFM